LGYQVTPGILRLTPLPATGKNLFPLYRAERLRKLLRLKLKIEQLTNLCGSERSVVDHHVIQLTSEIIDIGIATLVFLRPYFKRHVAGGVLNRMSVTFSYQVSVYVHSACKPFSYTNHVMPGIVCNAIRYIKDFAARIIFYRKPQFSVGGI